MKETSVPKPKSDSRDKIIESARALMRRQGYHATGLAQVIEHSGAPRGSVYYLFPGGKEQMAVESVHASTVAWTELIRQTRATSPTPRDWVQRMANHFAEALRTSNFTEGCPVTTVTLDTVPTSQPLTHASRAAYQSWLTALAEGLVEYGITKTRADNLAMLTLTSLEGALVLCRAFESTEPMDRVTNQVLALIDAPVTD